MIVWFIECVKMPVVVIFFKKVCFCHYGAFWEVLNPDSVRVMAYASNTDVLHDKRGS